jgi:transposase
VASPVCRGRIGEAARDDEHCAVAIAAEDSPAIVPPSSGGSGRMEIVLSSGERVIVGADVEAAALARVIKALVRR